MVARARFRHDMERVLEGNLDPRPAALEQRNRGLERLVIEEVERIFEAIEEVPEGAGVDMRRPPPVDVDLPSLPLRDRDIVGPVGQAGHATGEDLSQQIATHAAQVIDRAGAGHLRMKVPEGGAALAPGSHVAEAGRRLFRIASRRQRQVISAPPPATAGERGR